MAADFVFVMIALVNCGMGNLHSAAAGLRRAGGSVKITESAAEIELADKVVLPGDGHFAACMQEIEERGLRAALLRAAKQKPFLGICIGMQVLYEGSEEADLPGLGVLDGRLSKLPRSGRIPHIGWNTTQLCGAHAAFTGIVDETRFYYIHSYYASPDSWTVAQTEYGVPIAAAVAKDKLIAVQFHPEKSAAAGTKLLENFVAGD